MQPKLRAVPEQRRNVKAPEIELVRCDPPPPGRRSTIRDALHAQLDAVAADPGTWYRVATWPGKSSAHSAATTLKRTTTGYTFQARAGFDGGSALWARFDRTGDKAGNR